MSQGYGNVNTSYAALAATAFTWSSGYTTNRARLNDGKQDELAASAASAQASGQTLVIDMGGASPVAAIALLNHNLATGSCTVLVESDDNSGFTSPITRKAATTINTSAPYEKDTVLQFPQATERYWRLTFTHSGTKIVTLGELVLYGTVTTLSRKEVFGRGEESRFPQNRVESPTGWQRATLLSGEVRTKRMPFKDLTQSQRDELFAMWRATCGGALNLLYIDEIDSTTSAGDSESQQCLWGKLEARLGWTEDEYDIYQPTELVLIGEGREAGS